MITNNPDHKKAVLKKLVNSGKVILSISLAGIIASVTAFVYSNIIKEHEILFMDDFGNSYNVGSSTLDMVTGEEDLHRDTLLHNYTVRLKAEKEEKQNISLVYDENKLDSEVVEIDESYKRTILYALDRDYDSNYQITVGDLKQLKEIYYIDCLQVFRNSDISWLNYCTNLDKLNIELIDIEALECLKQIKGLNISRLNIQIDKRWYSGKGVEVDEEYFSFLNKSPNLQSLTVDSTAFSVNSDFLQKKIEENKKFNGALHIGLIDLGVKSQNIDVDKLMNFSSINIYPNYGNGVYDMPLVFTREEFNKIFNSHLEVWVEGEGYDLKQYASEVNKIYDKVDAIVKNIDVDEKMSDKEKLNIVLEYILKNLTYNETSAEIQKEQGVETNIFGNQSTDLVEETEKSYKDGFLYGIFNENGKVVCGNYAALLEILLNRVGVEAYTVGSRYHAYDLVNLDGEYYYVDPTTLDQEVIDMDAITEDNKHLILPQAHYKAYDTLITPTDANISEKIDIEKRVDEIICNAKKSYVIKFNNQLYTVSASVLIAILSMLGLAISKNKIKKIERREELQGYTKEELIHLRDSLVKNREIVKKEYEISCLLRKQQLRQNAKELQEELQFIGDLLGAPESNGRK